MGSRAVVLSDSAAASDAREIHLGGGLIVEFQEEKPWAFLDWETMWFKLEEKIHVHLGKFSYHLIQMPKEKEEAA